MTSALFILGFFFFSWALALLSMTSFRSGFSYPVSCLAGINRKLHHCRLVCWNRVSLTFLAWTVFQPDPPMNASPIAWITSMSYCTPQEHNFFQKRSPGAGIVERAFIVVQYLARFPIKPYLKIKMSSFLLILRVLKF
jgi:hypothetical protein